MAYACDSRRRVGLAPPPECALNSEACQLTPPPPSPTGGGGASAVFRAFVFYLNSGKTERDIRRKCAQNSGSAPSPCGGGLGWGQQTIRAATNPYGAAQKPQWLKPQTGAAIQPRPFTARADYFAALATASRTCSAINLAETSPRERAHKSGSILTLCVALATLSALHSDSFSHLRTTLSSR